MRLDGTRALTASALPLLALFATWNLTTRPRSTYRSQDSGNGSGALQGLAFYRERTALPPNAVFEATLEEVSRADAPVLIARIRNEQPGNPPFPFVIAYDATRIDPSLKYAVRGQILVKGEIWFYTSKYQPVLAGGEMPVPVLMQRMRGSPSTRSAEPSTGALENTYWKLLRLGTDSITVSDRQAEPHFMLHPGTHHVTGSGGCNRFSGSYNVAGDVLTFGEMVSTRMACAEGMESEQRFLNALGMVNKWRITGERLELLDSGGTVLARFMSVFLR
jgi:putative lipoprotein